MLGLIFHIIVYPVLLIASLGIGKKVADYVFPTRPKWTPLGIENGLVGFYSLLISFSLVQAGNNAKERTGYIHDTADKLALILRKSKLYDHELQVELYNYMSCIFDMQLNAVQRSNAEVRETVREIETLDHSFDRFLVDYIARHPGKKQNVSELINALEEMEHIYYRLLYSYHRNTPTLILFILILFSLLIGFLLGFLRGMLHTKMHISAIIFAVMSYIILYTIQDLDNPSAGIIKPDFTDIKNIRELYDNYFLSLKHPSK
ncbi:hypothetical protein H8S90_09935 [Olivibacter sp. SDN3]|uniref:bestrophin-like domain n=1 Tax=Olivibacter sp. SDN3 TaxID=2764720 RepID=UPI0016518AF4|nr:hypothetical protein [Olivibacter sp. SDN3]QNL51861.1 hypothetical protein H8S90_09935 [Olivibacter sp. SDN3]